MLIIIIMANIVYGLHTVLSALYTLTLYPHNLPLLFPFYR